MQVPLSVESKGISGKFSFSMDLAGLPAQCRVGYQMPTGWVYQSCRSAPEAQNKGQASAHKHCGPFSLRWVFGDSTEVYEGGRSKWPRRVPGTGMARCLQQPKLGAHVRGGPRQRARQPKRNSLPFVRWDLPDFRISHLRSIWR